MYRFLILLVLFVFVSVQGAFGSSTTDKFNICVPPAEFTYRVAQARDAGTTREEILQGLHTLYMNKSIPKHAYKFTKNITDWVFNFPAVSPTDMSNIYLEKCLNSLKGKRNI